MVEDNHTKTRPSGVAGEALDVVSLTAVVDS